ncbi:MAG TPA: DUF2975 domain-containing protein [Chitinophagaceae bacterium]|nr:DUF2975 domain-containing protein [Chitinophagaceae bacterium]
MGHTKIIAKFLSILSHLLGVINLILVLYCLGCLVTGFNTSPYGEGKYLHINYPFSDNPFMNIDNNIPYIVFSFLLPLSLYAVFFWLLGGLFGVFSTAKLFTPDNLGYLKRFYLFNGFAPILSVLIGCLFVEIEMGIWLLLVLHLVLAIFSWFIAQIFKQGLQLQHEQDLFI